MKPEIRDELKGMASSLADWPDGGPYIVPPGYFADLPARLTRTAADAPPADYFDTLPQRIKARLAEEGVKSPSQDSAKARRIALPALRHWAAAAVLALSVGIGGALLFTSRSPVVSQDDPLASVPNEVIASWAAEWEEEAALSHTQPPSAIPLVDPLAGIPASEIQAYLNATL